MTTNAQRDTTGGRAFVTAIARVSTTRAARYGRHLTRHMARKVTTTWDDDAGSGTIVFADGLATARLHSHPETLVIELEASPATVDRYQDVIARHLEQFGAREGLTCRWQKEAGDN